MKHYNRLYTELGILFANARKSKNLSQKDLAEKIGVTRMTISRWETGKCRIPNEDTENLCNLFGMDYDETIHTANERVLQAKENDIHNVAINDSIRVPLYDCIPFNKPFSEKGLNKFISISSYLLDKEKKYFALSLHYNTNSFKDGDILIFEHSSEYKNDDIVIAFVKEEALVMASKICLEANYECVGVLRRAIKNYSCQ